MSQRKNMFDGQKVQTLLNEKGLTAIEVAIKAGISRVQLSSYIHGRRNPKRSTVQRIADALHVSIADISGYPEEDFTAPSSGVKAAQLYGRECDDTRLARMYVYLSEEMSRQVEASSQLQVAQRLKVSHSYVNRMMSGKADVRDMPLRALIRFVPGLIRLETFNDPSTVQSFHAGVKDQLAAYAAKLNDEESAKALDMLQIIFGKKE